MTKKICRGGVHWCNQSVRVGQAQGVALSDLGTAVFLPHQGICSVQCRQLTKFGQCCVVVSVLVRLDIAMVNFFLEGSTLCLACLQGKAKMETTKLSLSSE